MPVIPAIRLYADLLTIARNLPNDRLEPGPLDWTVARSDRSGVLATLPTSLPRSALPVHCRVHAELLRIAVPLKINNDAILSPAPTHEEIASRISTHREAVTREMARLEESGLLRKEGRTLRIKNVERLHRLVEEGSED
jgi:Crp-like helix-turn-helix protein